MPACHNAPGGDTMSRLLSVLLVLCAVTVSYARTSIPPQNWTYRTFNGYRYHLYIPTGVQAGQKYPMALGLHGCCWDGADTSSSIGDPISLSWHKYSYNTQLEPTYVVAPLENDYNAANLVALCRSLFSEFPIDTQRIMLTGFSMGAAGVAGLINSYPRFFSCALYVAGSASYNAGFATVPCVMGVGSNDGGMKTPMIAVATSARAANGDSRGPLEWETGVNPLFKIFPNTGHGDGMSGVFGLPGIMQWAYSRINDGNRYPNVRFTQTSPTWDEILPATTTSVTLTADARDADGSVSKVEFHLDGVLKATVTSAPFATTLTGLAPGDHIATATAYDNGRSQGKTLDKSATSTLEFGIRSTPVVATSSLPSASLGKFYQDTLRVSGGNGNFNWSVSGALPTGLTLSRRGRIEGVPTVEGAFAFTVTVTDTNATTASKSLSISVGPQYAGYVNVTNLYKKSTRGVYRLWRFGEGEPTGATGGYGEPQGLYQLAPHPIFDGFHTVQGLTDATMIRTSSLAGDISSADTSGKTIEWVSFTVDIAARIHIGYPRTTAMRLPPWLNEGGYTASGKIFKTFGQDYIDYAKVVQPGKVILGPNDGVNTGASAHYCIAIEPEGGVGAHRSARTNESLAQTTVRRTGARELFVVAQGTVDNHVSVVDSRGRTVIRSLVPAGGARIALDGLAPGSYFVTVANAPASALRIMVAPR